MTGYRPMTLADLAGYLARTADSRTRWKLVWEFLEEYRWEPEDIQLSLLRDEPLPVGDERWDALLAALAEHLAAQHDLAAPQWAERAFTALGDRLLRRASSQTYSSWAARRWAWRTTLPASPLSLLL